MHKKRWLVLFAGPSTLWLLLLFVAPMAMVVLFTFRAGTFGAAYDTFTLEHYRSFGQNWAYHRLLLHSTGIALLTSLLSVLFAYPLAYYLVFQAGRRGLLLLLVLVIPAWISFLLRVFAWKLVLGSGGLLNSFLMLLGVVEEPVPLLLYSRSAVVVALVYSYIPFVALPIFASLRRINRSLLEASADLGSSAWQTFREVVLPLSLPGVAAGFLLVFIPTLGEYVTPLLLGGTQGVMYGNIIQSQFSSALNWPLGSLMSLVMLGMTLLLFFIASRFVQIHEWV